MPQPNRARTYLGRRRFLGGAAGALGLAGSGLVHSPSTRAADQASTSASRPGGPPIDPRAALRIEKLETMLIQPRWLFLKVTTNQGITGWGEPVVEGRARTVATAVEELSEYLVGQDPRAVAKHWQAMYRHAFYRGGPVLTSAISGIDQAL